MQISDKVELEQGDGFVSVFCTTKPVELVIVDGKKRFVVRIEESDKKQPLSNSSP